MHNLSTMARPPARSGVLLLVLAACGPEDGASGDTADMSSTGTTTPTTTSETTDIPTNLLECGTASPCGVVLANSGDPGLPTPTGYTADQTCALQQLATAGPLRLHYSDGCERTRSAAMVDTRPTHSGSRQLSADRLLSELDQQSHGGHDSDSDHSSRARARTAKL